jgi:hypothetical protein
MALVKQSGIVNGQVALLDAIESIVTASAGWSVVTREHLTLSAFPDDDQLTIRRGSGMYFSIRTSVNGVTPRMYMGAHSTAPVSTDEFEAFSGFYPDGQHEVISVQATDDDKPGVSLPLMVHDYYMWIDDDYLIVVVGVDSGAGWFQTFFMGRLIPFTGVSNGDICLGDVGFNQGIDARSNYDGNRFGGNYYQFSMHGMGGRALADYFGHVRDHAGNWVAISSYAQTSGTPPAYLSWADGGDTTITHASGVVVNEPWRTNISNIIPVILPCFLFAPHTTISGKYAPMGQLPGFYYISADGLEEGATVVSGSDSYQVFPAIRTNRVSHYAQYSGIAIKEP